MIRDNTIKSTIGALRNKFSVRSNGAVISRLFGENNVSSVVCAISLAVITVTFKKIVRRANVLGTVIRRVLGLTHSTEDLMTAAMLSTFFAGITTTRRCVSVLLPKEVCARTFGSGGLRSGGLSQTLRSKNAIASIFIP